MSGYFLINSFHSHLFFSLISFDRWLVVVESNTVFMSPVGF
jgi:hypothetical protein